MFKIGDKVKVTGNVCSGIHHCFNIGDVVEVLDVDYDDNSYRAKRESGLAQWISEVDVEAVETEKEGSKMKFQIGDKVKIVANSAEWVNHDFEMGEIVTITKIDSDDTYEAVNEHGHSQWVAEADVEDVEEDDFGMKFKVGDKAKIVANDLCHIFEIGDIVTILKLDYDRTYWVEGQDGSQDWVDEHDVDAIETTETTNTTTAKIYKYKVGNKVKVVNNNDGYHYHEIGDIVTITKVVEADPDDEDDVVTYYTECEETNRHQYVKEEHIEAIEEKVKDKEDTKAESVEEMETTYKVGDKLVIEREMYGHCFEVGDIVTVIKIDNYDPRYKAENKNGEDWWVGAEEVSLYVEKIEDNTVDNDALKVTVEYNHGDSVEDALQAIKAHGIDKADIIIIDAEYEDSLNMTALTLLQAKVVVEQLSAMIQEVEKALEDQEEVTITLSKKEASEIYEWMSPLHGNDTTYNFYVMLKDAIKA